MSLNITEQDTMKIDIFAIEREARALRAEATSRLVANARKWVSDKMSSASTAGGKTA